MRMVHKKDLDNAEYRGPKLRFWAGTAVAAATVGQVQLVAAATNNLLGNFKQPGMFSNSHAFIVEEVSVYAHSALGADVALLINNVTVTVLGSGKRLLDNVLCALMPSDVGTQEAVAIPAAAGAAVRLGAHRGRRYDMGSWRPLFASGEELEAFFTIPVALGAISATTTLSLWFHGRAPGYVA